jgi:hypothetical protein
MADIAKLIRLIAAALRLNRRAIGSASRVPFASRAATMPTASRVGQTRNLCQRIRVIAPVPAGLPLTEQDLRDGAAPHQV